MTKRLLALALLLWATPVHAGQIINDTFTEAANGDLVDHQSDSGGFWDESTDGGIRINGTNDNAIGNNGSARRATQPTSIGTPDMVVEADISVTNTGAGIAGIYAREASASTFGDHYACELLDDTAGAGGSIDFELYSRVASAVGSFGLASDFNGTSGTVYHMRLQVVGPLITCCVNHTTCLSGTSTEITTGNYTGIKTLGTAIQTIDNFKAYQYPRKQTVQ